MHSIHSLWSWAVHSMCPQRRKQIRENQCRGAARLRALTPSRKPKNYRAMRWWWWWWWWSDSANVPAKVRLARPISGWDDRMIGSLNGGECRARSCRRGWGKVSLVELCWSDIAIAALFDLLDRSDRWHILVAVLRSCSLHCVLGFLCWILAC